MIVLDKILTIMRHLSSKGNITAVYKNFIPLLTFSQHLPVKRVMHLNRYVGKSVFNDYLLYMYLSKSTLLLDIAGSVAKWKSFRLVIEVLSWNPSH